MKLFLLLILFPLFISAQDSTVSKSKYEDFSSRSGTMIKTETFEVGSQKEYKLAVIKSTDVETKLSVKAVQIYQSRNMWLYGTYISGILYIDWEEISGFIRALEFQLGVLETKPDNVTTYNYSTTNGVVSTCNYVLSGNNMGWNIAFSSVYKYSREIISGSALIIKKKDLTDIIALLKKANSKEY